MGATNFECVAAGKTAKKAFETAVKAAQHEHGHSGYTGTIAEKTKFVMISVPGLSDIKNKELQRKTAFDFAYSLIDNCDPRVDDKWGPAGCIDLFDGSFLFFGIASE